MHRVSWRLAFCLRINCEELLPVLSSSRTTVDTNAVLQSERHRAGIRTWSMLVRLSFLIRPDRPEADLNEAVLRRTLARA